MENHAPRLFVLLALALLALGSCGDASPGIQVLDLALPVPPASRAFLGREDWILSWRDAEGRPRTWVLSGGGRARIAVARGQAQSILAKPRDGGGAGLRYPGGLVSPGQGSWESLAHWGSIEVCLDWREGWLAEVCEVLEAWGLEPEAFNLDRLRVELRLAQGDPWLLAPQKAAALLAEGRFRADALSVGGLQEVLLPGPGPWAPSSPLAPGLRPAGADWLVSLPEGSWLFIGLEEDLLVELRPGRPPLSVRLPRSSGARSGGRPGGG